MIEIPYPCNMSKAMVFSTWQDHKNRKGYTGEPGTDIASYGQANIELFSVLPGSVIDAKTSGYNSGYGNYVRIDHGIIEGKRYITLYAHMHYVSVRAGQKVAAGQAIGLMGTTGNSEGVHVHFEIWENGKNIDPLFTNSPIYVPPPTTNPAPSKVKFKMPEPATIECAQARVTNAVASWLNLRSAPGGLDIGDLWAGDLVDVLGVVEVNEDVWFAVRAIDRQTGLSVYGYAAAYYKGSTFLEVL